MLQTNGLSAVEQQAVTYGGRHDAGSVSGGFFGHNLGHNEVVVAVEVAHGFVEQDEVEGLAYGPDYSHALLLPDAQLGHGLFGLVGYAQAVEQGEHFVFGFVMGELVLEPKVLHHSKLWEKAHFLWQEGQVPAAYLAPGSCVEAAYVLTVKADLTVVVTPVAVDEAEQRRFATARFGLDTQPATSLECDGVFKPYGRLLYALGRLHPPKYLGKETAEANLGYGL